MKFILAKKKQMDQIFDEGTGKMVPVTVVDAGPCFVSQIKTVEKDGYSAVQIAFGTRKHPNKPIIGHFKKLGANNFTKEIRVDAEEAARFTVGDKLTVTSFSDGDAIGVTGTSKGKGFAGVVRRYNFKGSPASHGHKDQLRMPGSIGATDPARVFKGTRMGGHMGDVQVTTKGLSVMKIDAENNQLYVKGAVPGSINGYLVIKGDGEMTPEKAAEKSSEAKAEKKEAKHADEKKEEAKDETKEPEVKEEKKEEVKA